MAIRVRRGGVCGSAPEATIALRPFDVFARELEILGSFAGAHDAWARAIALIISGRFDPEPMVDSVRALSDAQAAIDALAADPSSVRVRVSLDA